MDVLTSELMPGRRVGEFSVQRKVGYGGFIFANNQKGARRPKMTVGFVARGRKSNGHSLLSDTFVRISATTTVK